MKSFLILVFASVAFSVTSQDNALNQPSSNAFYRKNLIYLNSSFIGGSIGYERILLYNKISFAKSLSLQVDLGRKVSFSGGTLDILNLLMLRITGKKSNHFIYGIGVSVIDRLNHHWYQINLSNYNYYSPGDVIGSVEKPKRVGVLPAFKLGYRYMKPGGKFMFNVGVSSPEFLFLGVGLSF